MADTSKRPELVLNITSELSDNILDRSDAYLTITCEFRVKGRDYNGKPRWENTRYDWQNPTAYDVEDFVIRAQMNKSNINWHVYAWEAQFKCPGYVDLERAQRMVKTLQAVDRGLKKVREVDGPERSFGQYVLRVARALGAKQMSYHNTFAPEQTAVVSLAQGMEHIDHVAWSQENAWKEGASTAVAS